MRCLTISIFCTFIATVSFAQVLQTHYESIVNENHYTVAYPVDWNGDYFVIGTRDMTGVPPLKKAYMKRVDVDGNIVWEYLMQTVDRHNIAFHVDESSWGGGDVSVTGFVSTAGNNQRAIIYGVHGDGTISNPKLLSTPDVTPNSIFMHHIATSDSSTVDPLVDGSGWIAVGTQHADFDTDKTGLVVRFNASGSIAWSRHISTPNITGPNVDFDGLNHVVEVPDFGFLVSGSGNFYIDGSYRQGALATMLDWEGEIIWSKVYSHANNAHSTVAASATVIGQNIFQIANGQGSTGADHGFSVHRLHPVTGEFANNHSNGFYQNPYNQIKAMTLRSHLSDDTKLMVSGFLELPECPNNSNCEWVPGDHPPFLMQILQQNNGTTPMVDWHHIYDVPSTSYGNSGVIFDVFANNNQPYIYHPEMMLPISNTGASGYLIAGLHTYPTVSGDYDLELIITDDNGNTQCPTIQTNIHYMPIDPLIQTIGDDVDASYILESLSHEPLQWNSDPIPCDFCPVPDISYSVDCESLSLDVTLSLGDPSNLCFEVDYGDGSSIETFTGEQSIVHYWENGFDGGEMCVTSWCCDALLGIVDTQCFTITLPQNCNCAHCTPFLKACQINLTDPMTLYGPSPFGDELLVTPVDYLISTLNCSYGCDEEPYDVKLSLGNMFFNSLFESCLDNVSVKWYVDGSYVGETTCYNYDSIDLPDWPEGTYTVTAELTNCDDNACIDVLTSSLTVGSCIVPPNPQMHIHVLPNDENCTSPYCRIGVCPAQNGCIGMDALWIIDEEDEYSGFSCLTLCLSPGRHRIELKYTCPSTGETSSVIEYYDCPLFELGPDLFPIDPDWLPQYFPMSAEIDTDCNLKIDFGNMDTYVTGTFNPFQSIGETSLNILDYSEQVYSWQIWLVDENGNEHSIVEHNSFSDTDTGMGITHELVTVKDTFDQLISLRFELTGPDWLVSQANPESLSYEIPVYDCPPAVICASDIDGDSYVSINDLLALLSDFGTACE
jgi:hypothetical protein